MNADAKMDDTTTWSLQNAKVIAKNGRRFLMAQAVGKWAANSRRRKSQQSSLRDELSYATGDWNG